ncbi:uncharacterized protein LOC129300726 isoform X1 [Prosopis cineraria]|uniref:uncharacterized protein LOC129300726 isoform X1 n=1 Tax=Prosopis cineraria TaxID=364024 RepID=UPI0024105F67|nr:uncharacterized protein LOC129300726 isoform X1 [Prosopis cineraria]
MHVGFTISVSVGLFCNFFLLHSEYSKVAASISASDFDSGFFGYWLFLLFLSSSSSSSSCFLDPPQGSGTTRPVLPNSSLRLCFGCFEALQKYVTLSNKMRCLKMSCACGYFQFLYKTRLKNGSTIFSKVLLVHVRILRISLELDSSLMIKR